MVKVDQITICNRTIPLAFDTAALLAIEKEGSTLGAVIEAISEAPHTAARMDLVLRCAACGEKHAATGTPIDADWLGKHTSPLDLEQLAVAAVGNIMTNMRGEKSGAKKDAPVDVTLEELERKNVEG